MSEIIQAGNRKSAATQRERHQGDAGGMDHLFVQHDGDALGILGSVNE